MRGAGQAWHKSCFTCNTCNKRIDSSNLCERESEIYCRCKKYQLNNIWDFNYKNLILLRSININKTEFNWFKFYFSLLWKGVRSKGFWIRNWNDLRRNIVIKWFSNIWSIYEILLIFKIPFDFPNIYNSKHLYKNLWPDKYCTLKITLKWRENNYCIQIYMI